MDDDLFAELAPPLDDAPLPPRRKRLRMGQLAKRLGSVARPKLDTNRPPRVIENADRREASKRLLEGGKSKGVERGFGLTAPGEGKP